MKVITYLTTVEINGDRRIHGDATEASRISRITEIIELLANAMDASTVAAASHLVETGKFQDAWELVREDSVDGLWLDEVEIAVDVKPIHFGMDFGKRDTVSISLVRDGKVVNTISDDGNSPIRRMLDISVEHLSQEVVDGLWIGASMDDFGNGPHTIAGDLNDDRAFIILNVPPASDSLINWPEDLRRVSMFARVAGCDWIKVDRDGDIITGLPTRDEF